MSRGTVNKVVLIGRLGADPEVRYAPSGNAVANFRIATNHSYKDRDGNFQEVTAWHRIVAWTRLAEFAKQYLHKGMRVYVEGRIQYREWEDQNGVKRNTTEIIANDIQMLDSPPAQEEVQNELSEPGFETPPESDQVADEDVPF
jgi:single-strand DNA-binding protein